MKKIIHIICLALLPTMVFAQILKPNDDSAIRKLHIAEMAIKSLYVDSVDEQKLVEDGIRGMLEKLDPHSAYSTAKQTKEMTESLQGSFEGIGVQFNMVEDTLLVIQPVTNGPSEKVGIIAGDRIITVNDTAIAGVKMSKEEIMRRLRGKKGTKVNLGIVRRGISGKLKFVVTRDKIPVKTIDAVYMIRPTVGYIRIGSFGATTYDEFMTGVDSLKKAGMKDLIIDLQENGGGLMQAAIMIANEFLERNDLFTICFFDESYREALSFCGSKSGRNVNKVEETGLTPMFTEEGAPCFEQARMVLVCKKLYAQFLNEESVLGGEPVLKQYNGDEYHKMYISEILEVLTK